MLCFECNEVPYNFTCPSNNMLCFELTEVPFDSVANDVALLRDCLSLYPERKYINIISGITTPGDVSLHVLFLVWYVAFVVVSFMVFIAMLPLLWWKLLFDAGCLMLKSDNEKYHVGFQISNIQKGYWFQQTSGFRLLICIYPCVEMPSCNNMWTRRNEFFLWVWMVSCGRLMV